MADEDDEVLVRRSLDGDREAFGRLVTSHQDVLFGVALRMCGNREDAREIVQTVFLKAWKKLHTFDRRHRFFSWIYRIMMNETLNLVTRRRPVEPLPEGLLAPDRSPEEDCARGEVDAIVQRALLGLPPAQREVLVLRHFHDLSYLEMSELLGIPEKTVKSRLHDSRRRLEGLLRRQGVTGS
jgi:RNA polymerase sigma-70 factor (ECF subfamily)